MLVRTKRSNDAQVQKIEPQGLQGKIAERSIRWITNKTGLQYLFFPSTHKLIRHPWIKSADVIQLHNTHGNYFAQTALPKLSHSAPTVWTLHDMWSFTGHCSYSSDCNKWQTGCGKCPYPTVYPSVSLDTTALLWRLKKKLYQKSRLTVVSPSQWLANLAKSSPLLNQFEVHWIPNSVDTDVYSPIAKEVAREVLNIPADKFIIMFAVEKINDPRKGFPLLLEALHKIPDHQRKHMELLLLGQGGEMLNGLQPFPIHEMGPIFSEKMMAICYNSADVFILPTQQDNFPNGLLESMACGTPCISFKVGGVPEVIRHMETGYLAEYGSIDDLANGIQHLLNNPNMIGDWGRRSRNIALQEYTLAIQAHRYKELYLELVN
jgi:glycosyltransferase involved in cell wall biosynthesis